MPKINVSGLEVDFPFEPYEIQLNYMTAVIDSLNQKRNAVLESPTGTGKTLSLLCSTLAWICRQNSSRTSGASSLLERREGEMPELLHLQSNISKMKVIYSSRTHSQLSKAMSEFRTTAYKHLSSTLLGSRNQMCIHPDVSSDHNLAYRNAFCRANVKSDTCKYYKRVESVKHDPRFQEITDLEDLISKSRAMICCPFYLSRSLQDFAEVVFMPYNYLFDKSMAKKLNIHVQDSVIILDEGHNVDSVCEDSASVSLTSTDLAVAIKDITQEMKDMHDELQGIGLTETMIERDYSSEDLVFVTEKLMALESEFDFLESDAKHIKAHFNGAFVLSLLAKANLQSSESRRFADVLEQVHETIVAKNTVLHSGRQRASTLLSVATFVSSVFAVEAALIDQYFKVYINKETSSTWDSKNSDKGIEVNFWCFYPGYGMKALSGCYSIILTSGTLSPLTATISELGLIQPITGEFGHIVPQSQYLIFSLLRGPNKVELSTSYANRENMAMWREIGFTLQNFLRLIPDGVLVFFPSYAVLKKAIDCWQSTGLLAKINLIKPVYVEGSDKRQHVTMMLEYKQSVESGRGGVLIGVCRGKVAEGLDFSDAFGRAVLIFGLPFPPLYDPKVQLKKEYLGQAKMKDLSGDQWYQLEAIRAVNQAIGRVIRHRDDYGAIILCDTKFSRPSVSDCISKWLHPIRSVSSFGESIGLVTRFFKSHRLGGGEQLPRPLVSSTDISSAPVEAVESTSGSLSNVSLLNCHQASSSKTNSPTKSRISLMEFLSKSEEQGADAEFASKPLPKVTSCVLFKDVQTNATQPAKRRKITTTPIVLSDMAIPGSKKDSNPAVKRINDVKNLLCELKSTLEDESYARLVYLVKEFHGGTMEMRKMLEELAILFPATDPDFKNIFVDCQKLFSGSSLQTFLQFCDTHYYR